MVDSDSGSMGYKFNHRWHHCFISLTAFGKLLTTNVRPLDPGVYWYLAKDSFYSFTPGIIVVAAMGVFEMVLECIRSIIKDQGKLVKSCETKFMLLDIRLKTNTFTSYKKLNRHLFTL